MAAVKPKIGVLHSGSRQNADHSVQIDALFGIVEMCGFLKADLRIVERFADDRHENLRKLAEDLVGTDKVELLIAAGGSASAKAAQEVTAGMTNPPAVVFTSVADRKDRLADNVTGVCARTSELDAERLKWLQVLMPNEKEFGALTNSKRPNFDVQWPTLQAAAAAFKVQLKQLDVPSTETDIEKAIEQQFKQFTTGNTGIRPLLVTADPLFNNHRKAIIKLAERYKTAAIYQWRQFADDDGLMSFGTKLTQAYKIAGTYVGLILQGAKKPKDLPVETVGTELVVNTKTAGKLGVPIPPMLLARADELIR